jgi:hypothetical protein
LPEVTKYSPSRQPAFFGRLMDITQRITINFTPNSDESKAFVST